MKITTQHFCRGTYYRFENQNSVAEYVYFDSDPVGHIGNIAVHKISNKYILVNEFGEFIVVNQ